MDEEAKFAERKSRVVYQRANGRKVEWTAVGSITLMAAELARPLHLDDGGYTVYIKEANGENGLREAVILFNRLKHRSQFESAMLILAGVWIGMTILTIRMWFA